jgi:hypothetical protein
MRKGRFTATPVAAKNRCDASAPGGLGSDGEQLDEEQNMPKEEAFLLLTLGTSNDFIKSKRTKFSAHTPDVVFALL